MARANSDFRIVVGRLDVNEYGPYGFGRPAANSAAFSVSTDSATNNQCPFFFSMRAFIASAHLVFSTH
jgi:hypothetical protein